MEVSRYIEDVEVKNVEKRRYPAKCYVYLVDVTWSDGVLEVIARRYSEFFDLHSTILEEFPSEGGAKDPSSRIIPFLPGKVLFLTEAKAKKRVRSINEYCKGIVRMPRHVSQCETILNFFEQTPDDEFASKHKSLNSINDQKLESAGQEISGPLQLEQCIVVADYKGDSKKEMNLKAGEVVEIVEKNDNGWWLVINEERNRGWAPAAYLENLDEDGNNKMPNKTEVGKGTWYIAVIGYQAESHEEASFNEGDRLEVLEQNVDGWWFASVSNGRQGWVPGSYLERSRKEPQQLGKVTFYEQKSNRKKTVKRPPPKRSTVRMTIKKEDRTRARNEIRERLKKQMSAAINGEEYPEYLTVDSFTPNIEEGIQFTANEVVKVVEKSSNGWWYGKIGDREGWIPETYLKPKLVTRFPMHRPLPPKPNVASLHKSGATPSNQNAEQEIRYKSINKPSRPPLPKPPQLIKPTISVANTAPKLPPANRSPVKSLQQGAQRSAQPGPQPNTFQLPLDTRSTGTETRPVSDRGPLPSIPQNSARNITVDLHQHSWFKDVPRSVAESALRAENKEGYYIIRKSQGRSPAQPYSMTLYHQKRISNFHIRKRKDGKFVVGAPQPGECAFESVPELVGFYTTHYLTIGQEYERVKLNGSPNI